MAEQKRLPGVRPASFERFVIVRTICTNIDIRVVNTGSYR